MHVLSLRADSKVAVFRRDSGAGAHWRLIAQGQLRSIAEFALRAPETVAEILARAKEVRVVSDRVLLRFVRLLRCSHLCYCGAHPERF